MAKTTPQDELLKMHRRIYLDNKRAIDESVEHQDATFKSYEKNYLRRIKDHKKIVPLEEVLQKFNETPVVYVGDYHTLPQSQRSFLRLLRHRIQTKTPFMIGMEAIQKKHQSILEDYLADKISDAVFLKKIDFKEHWFFDLWKNFKPLFDFFKENKIPIFGIEANVRLGLSLPERDIVASQIISQKILENPDHQIIIFSGDLHIAPKHLPALVERELHKNKIKKETLILYQNSESIYWKLAQTKQVEQACVVQISANEFCRMEVPPIIAQQSYLNWLENEGEELDYSDAKQTFIVYLENIAKFLEIELGPEKDDVEIFTCGDMSFLKKVRESNQFSKKEIRTIKKQILRCESYTIPKLKTVYLANVSVNHAAEEASHMLKFLRSGLEFPRPMQDAFYANILHEALGFFGSKVINHRRKCAHKKDFAQIIHSAKQSKVSSRRPLEIATANLFLEHSRIKDVEKAFSPLRIKNFSSDLFLSLTHALGYALGDAMYYGLMGKLLTKEKIRTMYEDPWEVEGEAAAAYFELLAALRNVRIPTRL